MPIRAQIGPPRYILPVQAMGARFPERMIHHSLVRDLVMRHLISEWAPKPATPARGNGVRWSERQPGIFGRDLLLVGHSDARAIVTLPTDWRIG